MTLLSVIKDVCAMVGVQQPTSVFSGIAGNRTMQEMLGHANEMAQRIAYDNREWNKLKKTASLAGDGVKTAFDLPADYKRMLLTSNIWSSATAMHPLRFVPDTDEWTNRRAMNWGDPFKEWTMMGGQIHVHPAPEAGETLYFAYLNKNCIALNGGDFGDSFVNDLDVFALDERLLKLALIWQWKAAKGSPYAEDMGTYGDALTVAQGADSPAPIIVGRKAQMPYVVFTGPIPP